jgi:hypothetical protein
MGRQCVGRHFACLSRCAHTLNIPMQIWTLGAGSSYVLFFGSTSERRESVYKVTIAKVGARESLESSDRESEASRIPLQRALVQWEAIGKHSFRRIVMRIQLLALPVASRFQSLNGAPLPGAPGFLSRASTSCQGL